MSGLIFDSAHASGPPLYVQTSVSIAMLFFPIFFLASDEQVQAQRDLQHVPMLFKKRFGSCSFEYGASS